MVDVATRYGSWSGLVERNLLWFAYSMPGYHHVELNSGLLVSHFWPGASIRKGSQGQLERGGDRYSHCRSMNEGSARFETFTVNATGSVGMNPV
jgi:hypothetical protein